MRVYYTSMYLPKSMRVRNTCIECPFDALRQKPTKKGYSFYCEKWDIKLTWSNYSHYNSALIDWKECPIRDM